MSQQEASEVVANCATCRAGEGEEGGAVTCANVVLPLEDVGVGPWVESCGVGYTHVEVVPRVSFDEEACDVSHQWHVDEARPPVPVFGPSEVPRDSTECDEVIPAVGSVPVRLVPDPRQQHPAVPIAILMAAIRPKILANCESSVKRYVVRRSSFWLKRSTRVLQNPVVEDNLRHELVRPVPRRHQILRHYTGESSGSLAEPVVRQRVTPRAPRVQFVAVLHQFPVEERREIVDKDLAEGTFWVAGDLDGGSGERCREVLAVARNGDGYGERTSHE